VEEKGKEDNEKESPEIHPLQWVYKELVYVKGEKKKDCSRGKEGKSKKRKDKTPEAL